MKIGIISAREASFHPNRRLLEAAEKLGIEAVLIHPFQVSLGLDRGRPFVQGPGWPRGLGGAICRLGATISGYSLSLLRHLEAMAIPLVNCAAAVALCCSKFRAQQVLSQAGLPTPTGMLVYSPLELEEAARRLGGLPLVAKMVSGRQGEAVVLLESTAVMNSFARTQWHAFSGERQGVLVQSMIPVEGRREFRALVAGGKSLGAVELSPVPGDFRANLHLGSRAGAVSLPKSLSDLARAAALALGLDVAGVDLMVTPHGDPLVVEVNYSPGFRGLERAAGIDAAQGIMKLAQKTICQQSPGETGENPLVHDLSR